MGEYKAINGTRSFSPDDTDDKLFLLSHSAITLGDLTECAQSHFGQDIAVPDLFIEMEYIQTRCLGHDVYDPMTTTTSLSSVGS